MPTYQYRCQACTNELEAFQKFTDDPLTDCPDCGGSLRKVFARWAHRVQGLRLLRHRLAQIELGHKPATSSPAASSGDSKAAPAEVRRPACRRQSKDAAAA